MITSTTTTATDIIDRLVGVESGDAIDALRTQRPEARANAQASYDALFAPEDTSQASLAERFAAAYWSTALSGASAVAAHYREALAAEAPDIARALNAELPAATTGGPYGAYPAGPLSVEDVDGLHYAASAALRAAVGGRLAAALEHAHLLTYRPRDASPDAHQALIDAGWSTTGIVTLSQLVAFVHFQLRVVAGLAVLKEAR